MEANSIKRSGGVKQANHKNPIRRIFFLLVGLFILLDCFGYDGWILLSVMTKVCLQHPAESPQIRRARSFGTSHLKPGVALSIKRCSSVVSSACLTHCYLLLSSEESGHSPLTSTRPFLSAALGTFPLLRPFSVNGCLGKSQQIGSLSRAQQPSRPSRSANERMDV